MVAEPARQRASLLQR